jgi:hypothetical protein
VIKLPKAKLSGWRNSAKSPTWRQAASFIILIALETGTSASLSSQLHASKQCPTKSPQSLRHAMQQSISARIQHAIASLPDDLRAFGNHMYSPIATDDEKDEAEDLLFQVAYQNSSRLAVMSAAKMMRARYVCAAILHRYRRINQGGQGEGVDPLPTVFKLRVWIYDT